MKKYSVLPSLPLGIALFTLNTIRVRGSWLVLRDARIGEDLLQLAKDPSSGVKSDDDIQLGVQYFSKKKGEQLTPFQTRALSNRVYADMLRFVKGELDDKVKVFRFVAQFPGSKTEMRYCLERLDDGSLIQVCTHYRTKDGWKVATKSRVTRRIIVRVRVSSKDYADNFMRNKYTAEQKQEVPILLQSWDNNAKRYRKKNENFFQNRDRQQQMIDKRREWDIISDERARRAFDETLQKTRSPQKNARARQDNFPSGILEGHVDARCSPTSRPREFENHGDFITDSYPESPRQHASPRPRRESEQHSAHSFSDTDRFERARTSSSDFGQDNRNDDPSFSRGRPASYDARRTQDRLERYSSPSYESVGPPRDFWAGGSDSPSDDGSSPQRDVPRYESATGTNDRFSNDTVNGGHEQRTFNDGQPRGIAHDPAASPSDHELYLQDLFRSGWTVDEILEGVRNGTPPQRGDVPPCTQHDPLGLANDQPQPIMAH